MRSPEESSAPGEVLSVCGGGLGCSPLRLGLATVTQLCDVSGTQRGASAARCGSDSVPKYRSAAALSPAAAESHTNSDWRAPRTLSSGTVSARTWAPVSWDSGAVSVASDVIRTEMRGWSSMSAATARAMSLTHAAACRAASAFGSVFPAGSRPSAVSSADASNRNSRVSARPLATTVSGPSRSGRPKTSRPSPARSKCLAAAATWVFPAGPSLCSEQKTSSAPWATNHTLAASRSSIGVFAAARTGSPWSAANRASAAVAVLSG